LLARAVAGEAHVPFFSLTGSDFVEMFVPRARTPLQSDCPAAYVNGSLNPSKSDSRPRRLGRFSQRPVA
jgi:hypothetical protein